MHIKRKLALSFAAAASLLAAGTGAFVYQQDRHTPLTQCLSAHTPKAMGTPVIVVPGFANNDAYMFRLHAYLKDSGYTVYGWNGGLNRGPRKESFDALKTQLASVHRNHNTKVVLVGYSLGGVYARELARAYPDMVHSVVTLGAPFGMANPDGTPDTRISTIYNIAHGKQPTLADLQKSPAVPALSIYSKQDRVVPYTASQTAGDRHAYNSEVTAGHIAMAFNREVASVATAWLANPRAPAAVCTLRYS